MRKRDHHVLTNAASLLICGLLAGVVVAAAAFPAVAMTGLAAKAGAEAFDNLPSELTVKRAPQISYVYASDGKTVLATMYDENRRDVKLADISPDMQKAIIAAEDHNFYEHNGVDVKGVARAFINNSAGASHQQGASTLTMQYVRLAIAYSATHPQDVVAATEDTAGRKMREMSYALQVTKQYTKDEVLERYLNIAAFGNGAYGVYAASQVYFGKHPRDLNVEESAMLAGLVKAPTEFNPATENGYPQAVGRRDYVIDNMQKLGFITTEQAEQAKKVKLVVKGKRAGNGCVAANKNTGFFCDYFYRWWMDQETFGSTTYDRERRLKSGGYAITTTLDLKAQTAANRAVKEQVSYNDKRALMVAAVEPGTGYVRAMAVNRFFKLDDPARPKNKISSDPAKAAKKIRGSYPNTTNPLISGSPDIHGYQSGSVFKIFTIVAALEQGLPLDYAIKAPAKFVSDYPNIPGPATCPKNGIHYYCPTNAGGGGAGTYRMWDAFGASVNTYFIPLQQQVGSDKVIDAAQRLGIKFRAASDAKKTTKEGGSDGWGAFSLGVSATTPLDVATAYATLAADGKHCEPIPVQKIVDLEGKKLDVAQPRCEQVISKQVARGAIDAARCPVGDRSDTTKCNGQATVGMARGMVGKPLAGKTGTTDGEKVATLALTTKQLAVAGFLTDPDWPDTNQRMDHNTVNPAVIATMRDALAGKKAINFTPPNANTVYGDQRAIPNVSCQSVSAAQERLREAGFRVSVSSTRVASRCPAGQVAGTSPGDRTVKGGLVEIQISSGRGGDDDDKPRRPGRGN
ncbi:penicillin-binding protein [Micromonosporaceae bacterium DT55]|uniref:penicillin-binding protein n=1 Tax=Melissospora conviva TaxID=3388432 RepID=UPI003C253969